jgi:hypothetical protein
VSFRNCDLSQTNTDYILNTLDQAGQLNGTLDLSGCSVPSPSGYIYYNSLKSKGWTVVIEQITGSDENITGSQMKVIAGRDILTAIFEMDYTSWKAELISIQGSRVMSGFIDGDRLEFNVSHLKPGYYVFSVSKGSQILTRKVFIGGK